MTNGNLTLDELYAAANEMCRKWWGVDYTGKIELTRRPWRRTNGVCRYRKNDSGYVVTIVMSEKRNAERTRDEVLETLLHELVHWRLFTDGLSRDGIAYAKRVSRDDSPEFVRECLRVGAPFSGTKSAQYAAKLYGGVAK